MRLEDIHGSGVFSSERRRVPGTVSDLMTSQRPRAYTGSSDHHRGRHRENQSWWIFKQDISGKVHKRHVSNLAKFDVIRLYLRQQFPKHHIADFQEGTSRAQVFRVDGPHGHPLHYAVIGLDFLRDQTAEDLQQVLALSGLGDKLKEAGSSPVMVSKTGFSTEGSIAIA